jgi:hypothetical protein
MPFRSNFHLMAFAGFGLLAAMAGFSQSADASDEWPPRDLTFYVPYAPGGLVAAIPVADFVAPPRPAAFAEAMVHEGSP